MPSKSVFTKPLSVTIAFLMTAGATAQAADRSNPSVLDQIERELEHLANNVINQDRGLTFKRLGGTTPTNWEVIDSKQESIANLKCTSGNTNHHAAVATYGLGRVLDFNIFPVAVPIRLNEGTVSGTREQNCALKEWATNYTQYAWTQDTFTSASGSKALLINALNCSRRVNFNTVYNFDQTSDFGNPKIRPKTKTRYVGSSSLLNVAKDFSNMMIMDTVIGNDDRFPGGNTFFYSQAGQSVLEGSFFRFVDIRLFSLDNEAAFKRDNSNGENHMKKYLSRFDYDFLVKLGQLQEELKANPNKYPFLNFRTMSSGKTGAQHVIDNIEDVRRHVNAMNARCGTDIYFPR